MLFLHAFNKYVLLEHQVYAKQCYKLGKTAVNKTGQSSCPHGNCIPTRETDDKQGLIRCQMVGSTIEDRKTEKGVGAEGLLIRAPKDSLTEVTSDT